MSESKSGVREEPKRVGREAGVRGRDWAEGRGG